MDLMYLIMDRFGEEIDNGNVRSNNNRGKNMQPVDGEKKKLEIQNMISGAEKLNLVGNPLRKFICDGPAFIITQKTGIQARHLFLFSDILLICKPSKVTFTLTAQLNLDMVLIVDVIDESNVCGFDIVCLANQKKISNEIYGTRTQKILDV